MRRPRIVPNLTFLLPLALCGVLLDCASDKTSLDRTTGKNLFVNHCGRCHGVKGTGGAAPSLARAVLRHAADDEELFKVIKDGFPETGMPETLQMSDQEIRQVVGHVRALGRKKAVPLTGDPRKGKTVYSQGECATCHTVSGEGGNQGPDLSDIGARRGADHLRGAVLSPGDEKVLDPFGFQQFLVVRAVTRDGRQVRGARVNEDTFTIQLRTPKDLLYSFNKSELEELSRELNASLMPGYEGVFSENDLDDLVAYLAGLGNEQ